MRLSVQIPERKKEEKLENCASNPSFKARTLITDRDNSIFPLSLNHSPYNCNILEF
jgi:hypothetical protein